MTQPPDERPRLAVDEMRRIFNESGYAEMAASGVFSTRLEEDDHPTCTLAKEPHCTRSQLVSYWTSDGQMVALVHQYLRPDGTIGATGRPDPRKLLIDGVIYRRPKLR